MFDFIISSAMTSSFQPEAFL